MDIEQTESLLPEGTKIYREYEALLPDHAHALVTLSDLSDASDAAASARARGAEAYGYVIVLTPGKDAGPMLWAFDGTEIHIVTSASRAETLGERLRDAIGCFVLHFVDSIGHELAALDGGSSMVH